LDDLSEGYLIGSSRSHFFYVTSMFYCRLRVLVLLMLLDNSVKVHKKELSRSTEEDLRC